MARALLLLVRLLLIARLSHLSLLAKQGLAQRPGSAALSAALATVLATALATALVEKGKGGGTAGEKRESANARWARLLST